MDYHSIIMDNKLLTCTFTGHRPEKLPWGNDETDERCVALKTTIYQAVESAYDMGFRHFICGMARGCDLYFYDAVAALRSLHSDVTLEAAIPYPAQCSNWPDEDAVRWKDAVDSCDKLTATSEHYHNKCFFLRNKYMVDNSDLLISVYDGTGGGTGNTVRYAKSLGTKIMSLWL